MRDNAGIRDDAGMLEYWYVEDPACSLRGWDKGI